VTWQEIGAGAGSLRDGLSVDAHETVGDWTCRGRTPGGGVSQRRRGGEAVHRRPFGAPARQLHGVDG